MLFSEVEVRSVDIGLGLIDRARFYLQVNI